MTDQDEAPEAAELALLLRLDGADLAAVMSSLDATTRRRVESMLAGLDALVAARATRPLPDTNGAEKTTIIETRSDGSLSRIGRYRVHRLIGRGGQGSVYLASDETLLRCVALKFMHPQWGGAGASIAALRREARLAGGLDHRGICKVHDFGVVEGRAFLSMEYVDGGALSGKLLDRSGGRRAFPKPSDAARFIAAAADALHFAHEHGLIHRDVKPSNILVDGQGAPVVSDFGLARRVDAAPSTAHDPAGTSAYMAPEQFRLRASELDRRVDVWALGVVLFECLTGRRPFEADSSEGYMRAILDEDAPILTTVDRTSPRDLAAIVAKALSRERDGRYATAREFSDDLRAFIDGRPVSARRLGPIRRGARWARNNPVVAASLLAVVAALSGLAFVAERGRRSERRRADDVRGAALKVDAARVQAEMRRRLALSQSVVYRDPGAAFDLALEGAGGDADDGTFGDEHATEARTAIGAALRENYEAARYPLDSYASACGASVGGSLFVASDTPGEELRFSGTDARSLFAAPFPGIGTVAGAAYVGGEVVVAAILSGYGAAAGRGVAVFDVKKGVWGEALAPAEVPRVMHVDGDPRRNRVLISDDDGNFAFGRVDAGTGRFEVVGGAYGGLVERPIRTDWTPFAGFSAATDRFVVAVRPSTLVIGDFSGTEAPKLCCEYDVGEEGVYRAAIAADGRLVWALSSKGRLVRLQVADDQKVERLPDIQIIPAVGAPGDAGIVRAALDVDHDRVAVSYDGDVYVVDVGDKKAAHAVRLAGFARAPRVLEFSPDGNRVLGGGADNDTPFDAANACFRVWRVENPYASRKLSGPAVTWFRSAAFSQGRFVVLGVECAPSKRARRAILWDAARPADPIFVDEVEDAAGCDVLCTSIDPHGRYVAIGRADGRVVVRGISAEHAGVVLAEWRLADGVESVAFDPDARLLATACRDGGAEIRTIAAPHHVLFTAPKRPSACTFVALDHRPGELLAGYEDPRAALVAYRLDDPLAPGEVLEPSNGSIRWAPRRSVVRCGAEAYGVLTRGFPILRGNFDGGASWNTFGAGGEHTPFAAFVPVRHGDASPVLFCCTNDASGGRYAWSANDGDDASYVRRGVLTTALGVSDDGSRIAIGSPRGGVEIGSLRRNADGVAFETTQRFDVSPKAAVVLAVFSQDAEVARRRIGFVARDGTVVVAPFDPVGVARQLGRVGRDATRFLH